MKYKDSESKLYEIIRLLEIKDQTLSSSIITKYSLQSRKEVSINFEMGNNIRYTTL